MQSSDLYKFTNLKTNRLNLRGLEIGDAKQLQALRGDEKVNTYIDRPKSATLLEMSRYILEIKENVKYGKWYYWAICEKNSDLLIGTLCLWNFNSGKNTADIGYELLPSFQGKGLMAEVLKSIINFSFEKLNLYALLAFTNPENNASVALLVKNHFIRNLLLEEKERENQQNFKDAIFELNVKSYHTLKQ